MLAGNLRASGLCLRLMKALELKVPPPIVAGLVAAAMWATTMLGAPVDGSGFVRRAIAATLAVAGGCIAVAGFVSFRSARTTVDPRRPEATSSLVTGGIYRFTRNPMYLGLVLLLVAWAVFLASPWTLVGPVAFVLYVSRFQIAPEERTLTTRFGATYSEYAARTRRWL